MYGVTPRQGGKAEPTHRSRLTKYRDSLLRSPVTQEMLNLAEKTESRYEDIDKILDAGHADDGLFFLVKWETLPRKQHFNWNRMEDLYADVPDIVSEVFIHIQMEAAACGDLPVPARNFYTSKSNSSSPSYS